MAEEANTEDPNKHVADFLRYYCDTNVPLGYAVLLKGPWGSGKTYFINKFLEERKAKNAKYLYVSLYGLTSYRQIEDAFFRQLHPFLASRGMKIASDILKGAVKGALKIDFDTAGKDEASVDANLPDMNFREYFKTPSECLLVFDDLERCSIPIPEVLGYINSFVEHESFKVIILANEDEIPRPTENRYLEIKEKLIGQTLEVHSTAAAAIPQFLELIQDNRTREFIRRRVEDLLLIYRQSETKNLRIWKQSLWTFERLAICFLDKHWENLDAIAVLFRVVVALSFQIRSGQLRPEKFADIQVNRYLRYLAVQSGKETGLVEQLEKRYPGVQFDQAILTADVLKALLFDGWIDPDRIREELDLSPYYASPGQQPAWKIAWHIWSADDDEYEQAVAAVERQFANREFEIPGEILQVFGLRLLFSEIGLLPYSKADIVAQCKKYIDDLRDSGKIESKYGDNIDIKAMIEWTGLGFYQDGEEFDVLREYYSDVIDAIRRETLPTEGRNLLALLTTEPQRFFRLLCVNDFENSVFRDIPVLATIQPDQFVDTVLSLEPDAQKSVFLIFRVRYEFGQLHNSLREEENWIREVILAFERRIVSLRPLSQFRIKNEMKRSIMPLVEAKASPSK